METRPDAAKRPSRSRRKPRTRSVPPPVLRWGWDLGAVATLALLALSLIGYVADLPTTDLDFPAADPPAGVRLSDLYGPERNATTTFRWTKPDAAFYLPVSAPGDYRLALGLWEGPSAPPARPVIIRVDGAVVGTLTLEPRAPGPREYAFRFRIDPHRWASARQRPLAVEVQTAPFLPPDDSRALGVMLTSVALAAEPTAFPPAAGALLVLLPLVASAYAALRLSGFGVPWTMAALTCGLAALACGAAVDRPGALALAYRLLAHWPILPSLAAGFVILMLLLRVAPASPKPGESTGGAAPAPPALLRRRARRALPLALIVILAGGLRLYRLDALSLWIDEGATAYYARLPWRVVLGLQGWYDFHPPLYYALVKLAALVAPEPLAGRLVSVAAGTLTVGVLHSLLARLADPEIALGGACALALSPLHIWYSQEARMYAPVALLVATSYLALVGFQQARRGRGWATLYGMSVALAMYVDYSAAYALAPQLLVVAYLAATQRRRVGPLLAALAAAALAYLPWLPQLLGSIRAMGPERAYLAATSAALRDSALALLGDGGQFRSARGMPPTPWGLYPAFRVPILAAQLPGIVAGAIILARRSRLALLIAATGLLGPIGCSVLLGLISPGYAERTVLASVLGLATLLGATLAVPPRIRGAAIPAMLGRASFVLALGIAVLAISLSFRYADKQDFRALARDTATSPELPVVTVDQVTATLIDLYRPELPDRLQLHLDIATPGILPSLDGAPLGDFWLEYNDYNWVASAIEATRQQLRENGYEPVQRRTYGYPVTLERYARTRAGDRAAPPAP